VVEGLQLVQIPAGTPLKRAIAAYRKNPAVEYVEPNYRVKALATPNDPNDPLFPQMWGLENTGQSSGTPGADISATKAWSLSTGSSNVVVAVIDTGLDYTHPDLMNNVFRNTADCNNNGVDDDGDGYVDDCYGIAPVYGSSDPMDDVGHGTHVAGTIGASGNNGVGVTGVNWNVTLLPCKFLDSSGGGTNADAIACLDYVSALKDRGVNIVATHNSWGGGEYSQALYDAIKGQMDRGILFVAAAGNDFSDDDALPTYPANYDLPNIIAVAATNRLDQFTGFSNVGRHTVALAAPGDFILSTWVGGGYQLLSGTSMSSPHVTGVAALLKAQDPSRDWRTIKNLILTGGDTVAATASTITGKRLNAYGAMTCASSPIAARLEPTTNTLSATVGSPITLRYLNINCATAAGGVQVTVPETGETIALTDDAQGRDIAAGDGVYSGQWTPTKRGSYTLTYPNGDNAVVTVLGPYTATQSTSSYVSITGTNLNLGDDDVATVAVPFPIQFGGGTFNTVYVSSNGNVSFTNQFPAYLNDSIPTADPSAQTLVAPFWDDLWPVPNTAHNVFYDVVGTAPNRQFVVEWRDLQHFQCKNDPTATVTFEAVFSESVSDVQFNYKDATFGGVCANLDDGASAAIGIQTSANRGQPYGQGGPTVSDGSSLLWKLDTTAPLNPPPTISSISQYGLPAGSPDTPIDVSGTNFLPGSQVEFNGVALPTTYASSTQISTTIPASLLTSATPYSSIIVVANPGTPPLLSNSVPFYVSSIGPQIGYLVPNNVVAGNPTFTLQVNGSNFTTNAVVQWNGTALSSSYHDNLLYAVVPASLVTTAGYPQVTVKNGGGDVSTPITFFVTAPTGPAGLSYPEMTVGQAIDTAQDSHSVRFRGWNYARIGGAEYLKHFTRTPIPQDAKTGLSAESLPRTSSSTAPLPGIDLRPSLPAGFIPTSVATGDFNHDGKVDWAVTNGGENTVYIYLGNGDGTAQLPKIINLFGQSPVWITVADLRHNGNLDLIVGEADSGTIGILLGNGDGTFGGEQIIYVQGAVLYLKTGDFNRDGNVDVVAAITGNPSYALVTLLGHGDGTFSDPIYSLTPNPAVPFDTIWIDVADFDGDGIPDVIAADDSAYGGLLVFLGRGDGAFKFSSYAAHNVPMAGLLYISAVAGDLNHDGCADVVGSTTNFTYYIFNGNCDGTFGVFEIPGLAQLPHGTGDNSSSAMLADIDGDGNLDYIAGGGSSANGMFQSSGNLISVTRGDGLGHLTNPTVYRGELFSYGMAVADLNGDGHLDVVAASQDSDSVTVFLNDGKGGLGPPSGTYAGLLNGQGLLGQQIGSTNSPLTTVNVADINGDGKPDITFLANGRGEGASRTVSVLLNDGKGGFHGPPVATDLYGFGQEAWDFAFGDFRNVGHPDIVATITNDNGSPANIFYAQGNGDGTFAAPSQIPVGGQIGSVAVGDFNHDGKMDFVVAHQLSSTVDQNFELIPYLGNGDGTFVKGSPIPFTGDAPGWPGGVYVGDFNGDGKPDVIVRLTSNSVYGGRNGFEFLGNGDGTFQLPSTVLSGSDQVAVADLNHDGITDLVEYRDPLSDYPNLSTPKVVIHLGQRDGSLPVSSTYEPFTGYQIIGTFPTSANTRPAWIGDFNGDGNLDLALFMRYATGNAGEVVQFLTGNGDGTFTPSYTVSRLQTSALPQNSADLDGDGKDDMIQLDIGTSEVHYLPGIGGAPLQANLLSSPVVGSNGVLQLTFAETPALGTTVSLKASDPAVSVPSTITATGTPNQDVPFTLTPAFVSDHVFSIQATLRGYVAVAYGKQAVGNNSPSFQLYTNVSNYDAAQGSATNDYGIGVTSVNGYSTVVNLSCQNLPPGVTCVFGRNPLVLPAGEISSTTFILQTSANTPVGTQTVDVIASDGSSSMKKTIMLQVGTFTLNVNASLSTGLSTGGVSYTVSDGSFHGFTGAITFSCSNLPAGATCVFNPPSSPVNVGTNLEVVNNGVVPGNYTIGIVGTSGSAVQTVDVPLNVVDYTATMNSTATSLAVGQSSIVDVQLSPLNGFKFNITPLCQVSSQASLQCSFDNTDVKLDGLNPQTVHLTIKLFSSLATSPAKPLARARFTTILILGILLLPVGILQRKRMGVLLVLGLLVIAISCGGGGGGGSTTYTPPTTPPPTNTPKTATVTVQTSSQGETKTLGTVTITQQ